MPSKHGEACQKKKEGRAGIGYRNQEVGRCGAYDATDEARTFVPLSVG